MSELEKENTISFKNLYSRMNINSYQERSNFLEALYLLQIEEDVYNPKKYIYKSFPKATHRLEHVTKGDNGLMLMNGKVKITSEMIKCDTILDKDLVVVNLTDKENPIITKVVQRDITSFIDYLIRKLDKEELTYRQIKRMAVAKNAKSIEELHIALTELEKTGKIFHDKNSYKKWPKGLTLTKLELDGKGKPFFKIGDKKIYPLGDELKGAMQQDILAVTRKSKHIEKIISRKISHVVLEVVEIDGVKQLESVLLPSKEKINVRISSKDMKSLAPGDRILADVSLTKTDEYYEADFIDKLGRIDDPNIDIISIAAKYGFDINFSHEAMEEANNLPQVVLKSELTNRYDFSDSLLTFTIDCDETKDMDDAVSLTKEENGHYILGVHIADVAHYVKRSSALDKEAYDRGLSTYPANTVIPALPHILSNGICSLNPNTKRLTKSIIMELDENGELTGGISKFITPENKNALEEIAEITKGDAIFFIADEFEKAQKIAGGVRIELGKRLDLIEKNIYKFCWIVDFPMYELSDEGTIDFNHNPFSMPQGGKESLENKDPLDIYAYQYDLVGNGYELASGAVRNHDQEIMIKAVEIAGYTEEDVKGKFGALYNAFSYGTPPHAGAAPGVDRIVMLLAKEDNIREVVAFPKNKKARDVLMRAPSKVSEQQLKDVHIKLNLDEKEN